MGRIARRHARGFITVFVAIATVGAALAQEAKVIGTLDGHTDPVYAVTWSPDGKTLATAGFDNTVRLWDAGTRKEIKKYEGHSKLVLAVAIAPNGKEILSGSLDNTAKVWDYPTTGPAKTFAGHAAGSIALAVKPDGKQFAAAAGKSIKVWDVATGAVVKDLTGHSGDVLAQSWRGDGSQLATGDKAHTIRFWKSDLSPDGVIEIPNESVLSLVYLPNNQQLVSAGSDGIARLWQLPASLPRRIDTKGSIVAFDLSQDGKTLATAGADKVVRIWNTTDGKSLKEIPAPDQPIVAVAFRQDGTQVAIGLAKNDRAHRRSRRRQGDQEARRAHFADHRARLSRRRRASRCRRRRQDHPSSDASDAKTVKELKGHAGRIHALAFSPKDGNFIVSASADKTAKLWDVNHGKSVRDFSGHGDAVLALNLSRDGTKLVTGSADKTVRIWNLADGKTLATLSGHTGPVQGVSISNDATRVASGSADQSVRFWDLAIGRELQEMSEHHAAIVGVGLLPDNKSVASAGVDNAIRVWTPSAVRIFAGHDGPIFQVAAHPNGSQLYTASADKSIKAFDVNDRQGPTHDGRSHGRGQGRRCVEGWRQTGLGLRGQDGPRVERGGRQAFIDNARAPGGGGGGRGCEQ